MNFPFLPERASTFADSVDQIGVVLTALTIFFTVLVFTLLGILCVRYRRGSNASRKDRHDHSIVLELGWSIIPLILGLAMYAWAVIPYSKIYNPPANAEEIFVIGKRWMWHIEHTNGVRENNELHIPIGKPFKLTLISQDVIHGFYVPAFRLKRDVLPGKYNTVWFEATEPGKYHLFCTEYCGTNHSEMGGWVYVMKPADYQAWLKTGAAGDNYTPPQSPAEHGAELFTQLACGNCHGTVDSVRAPSLLGLVGRKRNLLNGQTVVADDNYIRNAICKPEDNLLQGYGSVSTMPSYTEDQITEEQVHDLVAYIKSLSLGAAPSTSPAIGGPVSAPKHASSTPTPTNTPPAAPRTATPAPTVALPGTAAPPAANGNSTPTSSTPIMGNGR